MDKETRILILEDQPTDVELAVRELRRADITFEYRGIETKESFLKELVDFSPDVILSDFALPQFNGLDALRLLKDLGIETPFILCTGSLTEEVAVECMKEGAFDYILKNSLKRLPSAVLHALRTSETRRSKEAALKALQESEEKFRSIVETTNEWIWAVDLDGRITYSNPAIKQILGYSDTEVLGRSIYDFLHEDDCEFMVESIHDSVDTQRGWSRIVKRFRHKDGHIRHLESSAIPVLNAKGELIGHRGSDRDITERKLAEDQLLHDAFHDGLTGLANRKLFMEHLQLTIERRKSRRSNEFAVLYLDFDRFKVINDSLGHTEGDNLLRYIARRIELSIRPGDLIARLGGDEFAILISELGETGETLLVAERILNDLKTPFDLAGKEIYITTSIGIALNTSKYTRADDMIRDADIAMYSAKTAGREQYQIFDEAMHVHASRKLRIETEMRAAFARGEFCLHYQPIVDLATGVPTGFEALIRWNHPEHGTIPPGEFIPIAEENGFILKLGKWTVEESCRQLHEWQKKYLFAADLTISVNLSSKEFRQPDLGEKVAFALQLSGLPPRCLKLEITESHIMENSDVAVTVINRLRKLGVEFSLDDFGTGYSSLSYLHRLPFTYLKIDRSFVHLMTESEENAEIVNTIVRLARSLKLKVIAEGLETEEQIAYLRALECEFGQGYFFSKPLSARDAQAFVARQDFAQTLPRNPEIDLRRSRPF